MEDLWNLLRMQLDNDLKLMPLQDSRGHNLLAFCALHNNYAALKIIYEHSKNVDKSADNSFIELFDWTNQKSQKGLTALHFASFHGNIEMIEFLVTDLKADISIIDNQGLNVLHAAAQGDKPASIIYFLRL